jgi:hypothetical protein
MFGVIFVSSFITLNQITLCKLFYLFLVDVKLMLLHYTSNSTKPTLHTFEFRSFLR